jgi:hypothetical protein
MIAVAGMVAEQCWHEREVWHMDDFFPDYSRMSESDWRQAGCQPGEGEKIQAAIAKVLKLLNAPHGPLWPALCQSGGI